MKISEQWLREWADPAVDTAGLAEQLTMAGLEVDGIEGAAPALDGVVVGQVLDKSQHPDADRLSVCVVDAGGEESLSIVCGATNVRAGGYYPVATIGTKLPGGLKIKKSKLRGVESFGMLCSAVELGIADEAEGLLDMPAGSEPGMLVKDALALDDQIIDLDLTPNRADCFSVLGVGRDIAAVNGLEFSEPDVPAAAASIDDVCAVELAAGSACPVFVSRVIRNIDAAAETPLWMAERLRRAGIRPLQPVVDVTNYVMLEYGQPMHAYDEAKLTGGLQARMAGKQESLTLLDGQSVELTDDVLVIADESGPVALAGIMGGEATAVADRTTDIVLESAFFAPAVIMGRARRYGLHTDASLRFERGVDFSGQARAIERATSLLLDIVGGEAGPVNAVSNAADLPARPPVELRRARLDRLLGIDIPDDVVRGMLERLGLTVETTDEGWRVTPTPARFDIEIEEDLIEEVVRLYGYDQVLPQPQLAAVNLAASTESEVPLARASALLADQGYQEVISYSFVHPDLQALLLGEGPELQLANPLSKDQSVMRRSLWPGLIEALRSNQKRQESRVRLFEHGVIFTTQGHEIEEKDCLAGVAWGPVFPEHWGAAKQVTDMFDIKSNVESLLGLSGCAAQFEFAAAEHPALRPGCTARIGREGAAIGWVGELHPRLVRKWNLGHAPVLFELEAVPALSAALPVYQEISKFPSVRRDFAVLLSDAVTATELVEAVTEVAGPTLRDVRIFDIYRGEGIENGLKSVALGLILQETSRTLTELDIESVSKAVVERLSSQFNASIRE